jgi:chromosome segregation ATPase
MEGLMAQIETIGTTEMTETDTAWLQALEEKVHAAAGRIRQLREENATLRQRIEELEERLDQLAAVPVSGEAARWSQEREEIRGRVERLVEHLAGLGEL